MEDKNDNLPIENGDVPVRKPVNYHRVQSPISLQMDCKNNPRTVGFGFGFTTFPLYGGFLKWGYPIIQNKTFSVLKQPW